MSSIDIQEIHVFKRHSTASLFETFLPMGVLIDRYVTLGLFAMGVIGNIVAIIVWWYPKLRIRESSVLGFIFLSAIDLVYLLLAMINDLDKVWSVSVFYNDGMCKMFQVIRSGCCFLSLLMVLTVCIQHIISLKNRESYEYYKCKKWTYLIAVLLAVVSVLFSIAEGVFSSTIGENPTVHECSIPRDVLNTNKSFKVYYWLVKFFLRSILIVSISGTCIYILHINYVDLEKVDGFHKFDCSLREKGYCKCSNNKDETNNKNSLSLAKTISIIGFYTVFISIPPLILVSLEPLNTPGELRMKDFTVLEDPIWERYFNFTGAKIIFNELYLSKFSISIFIYFGCNRSFRECFKEIFGLGKFIQKFQMNKTDYNVKSPNRPRSKPISYYINRSQTAYPFTSSNVDTGILSNSSRKNIANPLENVRINNHRRIQKVKTLDRSRVSRRHDARAEPLFYSLPQQKIPKKRIHQCNKLDENPRERRRDIPKSKPKEFHNVCSEFKYVGSSSSSSSDESPIIYVKNCRCHESSESDSGYNKIAVQTKRSNRRQHQV